MTRKKDKIIAIISIITATIFTTAGQLLWKYGVTGIENAGFLDYINVPIILGCLSYALAAVFMVIALKLWELSKVHPFLALGFVWVTLFAPIFLNEVLTFTRIAGIVLIIAGVIFIGK